VICVGRFEVVGSFESTYVDAPVALPGASPVRHVPAHPADLARQPRRFSASTRHSQVDAVTSTSTLIGKHAAIAGSGPKRFRRIRCSHMPGRRSSMLAALTASTTGLVA
jgi:hypothetical protein